MLKEFSYNNHRVYYSNDGVGNPLVLLHGLCEDISVWETFTKRLAHRFKVICIHLPGNGLSGYPTGLSIDYMADVVKATMDMEKIKQAVIMGHSMGGYVALSMADRYSHYLKGMGLFHSMALADDEEKKVERNKSIDFITRNGRTEYIKHLFPNLFYKTFKDANQRLINQLIAKGINRTSDESVIATIAALRDRADRTHILKETTLPVLFIAGKNDTSVPFDKLEPQIALPKNAFQLILNHVNHMGMFENFVESSQAVIDFAEHCYR